jgi:Ion channel
MHPMLRQILVGSSICVLNIVIHALLTVTTIHVARVFSQKNTLHPWLHLLAIMIATVSVLMGAHVLEVFVWAIAYAALDAVPEGSDLVYFAFVNYSTLGYGDIVPVARWRLLGPMAAMNGILLFGWSTAVIFEVLRRTISEPETFPTRRA